MNSIKKPMTILEDRQVPVQAKLAAAWTSLMFLFAYMDILTFYKTGIIEDILDGVVHEFAISQTFLVLAVFLMTVPIAMVLLSTTLPARASRMTSIVVASIYVLPTAYNLDGETWTEFGGFFGLGIALELAVLVHHPHRMDVAPHVLGVDARARRTASPADPDGTVGT